MPNAWRARSGWRRRCRSRTSWLCLRLAPRRRACPTYDALRPRRVVACADGARSGARWRGIAHSSRRRAGARLRTRTRRGAPRHQAGKGAALQRQRRGHGFGIAKALQASTTSAPGGTLTQIGTALGTPACMAPEHATEDPATDHRVDLLCLGRKGLRANRRPASLCGEDVVAAAHGGTLWLNQVQTWLSPLAQRQLRRGVHRKHLRTPRPGGPTTLPTGTRPRNRSVERRAPTTSSKRSNVSVCTLLLRTPAKCFEAFLRCRPIVKRQGRAHSNRQRSPRLCGVALAQERHAEVILYSGSAG